MYVFEQIFCPTCGKKTYTKIRKSDNQPNIFEIEQCNDGSSKFDFDYMLDNMYLTLEKYSSWNKQQAGINSIISDITETDAFCAADEEYCPTCH